MVGKDFAKAQLGLVRGLLLGIFGAFNLNLLHDKQPRFGPGPPWKKQPPGGTGVFLWFGIYYSTARGFCKKHPLSPAKREKSLKKTSLFPFTRQKLPGGGVAPLAIRALGSSLRSCSSRGQLACAP